MAEVVLEDVVKVYGEDVVAVNDMNLDIPDGEFVVFVGPSGCGKSTALRMIAGLEDISAGQISIGENIVNDLPPRERDIAMVFQNYALYPHMNVRENMGFALKLKKLHKTEIAQKVEQAAKILGIEHFLDRKPKALSGGQRQRVALGRAIVREPKAFLMDEPLSNLDAKLRVQMRTEIAKLHNRLSTTTIYVTHDQTEAMTMADRIVVLKDGVVQQVDAPQQMYQRPENIFVAGFIGSPAMNFLRARLERDSEAESGLAVVFGEGGSQTRLPLSGEAVTGAERGSSPGSSGPGSSGPGSSGKDLGSYVGEEVVLGIRPEHIEDASLTGSTRTTKNTVEVSPQVIESMGSEKYVYFEVGRDQAAHTRSMEALVEDVGGQEDPDTGETGSASFEELMVARVSAESGVRHGEKLLLEIDADKVSLFDPETEQAIL